MNAKTIQTSALILAVLSGAGCSGETTPTATPTAGPTETAFPTATQAPAPQTWVGGIDAIFAERCLPCHDWADNYEDVAEEIRTSALVAQVGYGHQISGAQQQAVLAWVDNGYPYDTNSTPWPTPDESPTPTPIPPPTPTPGPTQTPISGPETWATGIDNIFDDRCTGCHAWANTYDGVVGKIESGALAPRVESNHHISGQDKTDVLNWISDGYPE